MPKEPGEELVDTRAFRAELLRTRPSLSDWEPVLRAYHQIVGAEPLRTRADADDYADPRWHLIPWTEEHLARFRPPTFEDGVLTFFVEDHRAMMRVRIHEGSFTVEVELS